ncbi:MAG: Smr/MutS family protein [Candidatus Eremiobacteraeota bacterium]|nr:Smr/MutS family protein [Candidatus Eremiobacteraeota bacterium]MBC5802332.1 Smr/MutS family protein [Candidatus Eremiobacteraeota bacterium]
MDHVDSGLKTVFADERTLEVLDFAAIRELVARQTTTDRAAAFARNLRPTPDLAIVRLEQAATVEMRAILGDGAFSLPRTHDVGEAVARAARGGSLGAEELRDIGFSLAAADAAVRRVRSARASVLQARCRASHALPEVAAAIDRAVGERGEVLDRASPALGRLRRNAAHGQDEARDRCAAILRQPRYAKAIGDTLVTVRDGRFVVPVKTEFSGMLPGVVHDTSSSGHTLFVEPLDALEVNNRLRTLRLEEEREVTRILAELSALVGSKADQAQINLSVLTDLDLVLARARVAETMDAVAPRILDDPLAEIRRGRHPLLGARAVPQSLRLDGDVRIVIISGPNMGGKTVTLKLLGLFVAMAYCGMQLPADEGTAIGAFDYVGCDAGDEQSIAENASTFSAHLRRLRAILEATGARSLVLIDEIASGTEPASSAALAIALLEELLRRGAHGIVTTHSTELKLFAAGTPHVQNASVRFDPQTYTPTYQLDLGSPGRSLAFPLARALGLDENIVSRAEMLLSRSERDYDRALEELAEVRSQATLERDALARECAALAGMETTARQRSEALERERRSLARQADDRLGRALREFTAELERRRPERSGPDRARVTSGQAALLGRVLDDVHRDLGVTAPPPAPQTEEPQRRTSPAVGDRVFIETLASEGDVAEDYGDTVLVAIGAMKTVVPKTGVRIVRLAHAGSGAGRRARASASTGAATLEAASGARTELDVRGKRFVEAEPLVDKWIDESALLGLSPLRLIHGKGTGLLGRGLQQYLKTRAGVRDVRYGNADEGSSGVTIFDLG